MEAQEGMLTLEARKGREENAMQERGDKKQKQVPSPHHSDIRTDKDKMPL